MDKKPTKRQLGVAMGEVNEALAEAWKARARLHMVLAKDWRAHLQVDHEELLSLHGQVLAACVSSESKEFLGTLIDVCAGRDDEYYDKVQLLLEAVEELACFEERETERRKALEGGQFHEGMGRKELRVKIKAARGRMRDVAGIEEPDMEDVELFVAEMRNGQQKLGVQKPNWVI